MPLPWTTTLGTIRSIAAESVLGIPSGTNTVRLNHAIRSALLEYHTHIRPDRAVNTTLSLQPRSGTYDLAGVDYTSITDFIPEHFIAGELVDANGYRTYLEPVDYGTIYDAIIFGRYAGSDIGLLSPIPGIQTPIVGQYDTGAIGFDNNRSLLYVWPEVDVATQLRLHYNRPLTAFDASTDDATVINVPDEHVNGILTYGVPLYYEMKTLESSRLDRLRKEYDKFILRCKSSWRFGGQTQILERNVPNAPWRA